MCKYLLIDVFGCGFCGSFTNVVTLRIILYTRNLHEIWSLYTHLQPHLALSTYTD